jgi:hypothetical protein
MKKSIEILNKIAGSEGNSPSIKRLAQELVMRIELAVECKDQMHNDLRELKANLDSYVIEVEDLVSDPADLDRLHLDIDNLMHSISSNKRNLIAHEYTIFHSETQGIKALIGDIQRGSEDRSVLDNIDLDSMIRTDHGIGDMIDARLIDKLK